MNSYSYRTINDEEDSLYIKAIEEICSYFFSKEIENLAKRPSDRKYNIYGRVVTKLSIILMIINGFLIAILKDLDLKPIIVFLAIIPILTFIYSLVGTKHFINIENKIEKEFRKNLRWILFSKYCKYYTEPYFFQMLGEMEDMTFLDFMKVVNTTHKRVTCMSSIQYITFSDEELSTVLFIAESIRKLKYHYVTTHKTSHESTNSKALNFFGLNDNYTKEELKRAYKKKIKEFHPDNGGTNEDFQRVTNLYKSLL